MTKPCFNIVYEEENITIPEIDDYDLLFFGLYFMKIYQRKLHEKNSNLKILNF